MCRSIHISVVMICAMFWIAQTQEIIESQQQQDSMTGSSNRFFSNFFKMMKSVPVQRPVVVPIKVPVKQPIAVPVPIKAPVKVPVKQPIAVPVPIKVPVKVPVKQPVSVPVPVKAPVKVPVKQPIPVPVPIKVPVKQPVVVPVPVKVPVKVPISPPIPKTVPVTPPVKVPVKQQSQITTFYVHGDVPYSAEQASKLEQQMKTIPSDAEFVVHVGDIRKAGTNITCIETDYTSVVTLFRYSQVPVFVLVGDNDVRDCPNINQGLQFWNQHLLRFESKYWNHNFTIQRQTNYPDNYAFIHKSTLYIGLNIIGGQPLDINEWDTRLTAEAVWTMDMIRWYRNTTTIPKNITGRIVLFGHANPGGKHAPYFQTISSFIKNELQNKIPVVYFNGDAHKFMYNTSFYSQISWIRIGVTGLAVDPLMKITIDGTGMSSNPQEAFIMDRRL